MFKSTTTFRQNVSRFGRTLSRLLYGAGEQTAHDSLRRVTRATLPTLPQLKLLPRTLSPLERRVALSLVSLCLVSAGVLGARWYLKHTTVVPKIGGEYTEGILGFPLTTNPLLSQNGAELDLAALVTRGLFQHDASGTLVPDLAQDWSISSDQKTYLVSLKPSLQWSDGYPLTADDVVFTFQTLQNPALPGSRAKSFSDIVIKRQSSSSVSFTLRAPYAYFLESLRLGLLPAHVWQSLPLNSWLTAEANLQPVGSGPWRFQALARDPNGNVKSYTLEPNPFTHTAKPFLTKVILHFYPDASSLGDALHQGLLDGVGGSGAQEASGARKFASYQLFLPQYSALFYNERAGLLKVKAVRQGLSAALNRTELINSVLEGQALPDYGPFPAGGRSLALATGGQAFDPAKAQELFASAGFKREQASEPYQNGPTTLELTLTVADQGEPLQVAQMVKRQWEAVGVKVNLNLVPANRLVDEVVGQRNFQVLLSRELVGLSADPYPFWHSSQAAAPGLNLSGFQNREADRLLSEARQSADRELQLSNYRRFQAIVADEVPATFLYSSSYPYALNRALDGFTTKVIGQPAERFTNLYQWYRVTARRWQ